MWVNFGIYLVMLDNLAIVDVETTGMRAGRDKVIEVGVVLVDNNKISKKWSTLVNPEKGINPYIISITGIDPHKVRQAPTFAQIKNKLWDDLNGRTLVAHNVRFDYSFLKAELECLDTSYAPTQLCTVRLSRKLFPTTKGHGLDAIISRFNFSISNRHRALDDALILWQFLQQAEKMFGNTKLAQTIETIVKKPTLPPQLEESLLQQLPECPGVYKFYDSKDSLLYVGKSINIKARVRSHFYDDLKSHKELQIKQKIARIETITTAGELEALLLESQLIKSLQPIYNHQLRRLKSLHTLTLTTNPLGYKSVTYKASSDCSSDDVNNSIALFRTKRTLTKALELVAEKHSLCKKLVGLEKTSSSCFGYRLKTCLGACVGKEPVDSYNLRLESAFSDLKIPYWPYNGAIVIQEENQLTGQRSQLVFDKWCYVGKIDEDDHSIDFKEMTFDYDTYKILRLFIKKQPRLIKELTN